ncbi:DUF3703 domain-containing protein [Tabrizicola sp.]|uniref:DUF3703 domain-containing protein n=1 Tax=Tabrizicola sp. TaxID=2005166 RepID=UPI003BAE3726
MSASFQKRERARSLAVFDRRACFGSIGACWVGPYSGTNARDLGQILWIVGAATKTAIGLIPTGNICGSHVSPFKRLSIPKDLAGTLAAASKQPPIQITHRS